MPPKIPFFSEFRRPLLEVDPPRLAKVRPGPREVGLDSTWRLRFPGGRQGNLGRIGEELTAFLKKGARLRLGEASGRLAGHPTVSLKLGKPERPEGFTIAIRKDGIDLVGDEAGLRYGVYHLEDLMRSRGAAILPLGRIERAPRLATRILRSPMAFFYGDEFPRLGEAYPDAWLDKMAHQGFNGVWLRGRLSQLARVDVFPEFGEGSALRLEQLAAFAKRASRYGIKPYLFFNEPHGLPADDPFFRAHPGVRGEYHAPENAYALCSSTPEVQTLLREGMEQVFSRAPGLGGVLLITASELHSHCWSHVSLRASPFEEVRGKMACPRCRDRKPGEVVAEIVASIRDGVRAGNPEAEVIVWNWSWSMWHADPQTEVVRALPKDVAVMGDFERGSERVTDGFKHLIDEYSLSFVGPADRFTGTAREAAAGGRRIFAKLQVGTTHEIGSIPHFPLYRNLAEKFRRLEALGVTGAMECWNFGNILSPNTRLAQDFSWDPMPKSVNAWLTDFATRHFGAGAVKGFLAAQRQFSRAATHYPHSIPFLYWGPQHFGPAYPLLFEKVGKPTPVAWMLPKEVEYDTVHELMKRTDFGDDIDGYRGPFSAEKLISCLRHFVRDWRKGLACLEAARKGVSAQRRKTFEREVAVCAAVASQIETAANFTEFTLLRDILAAASPARRRQSLERMIAISIAEIRGARAFLGLIRIEPMLGFHGEAFGFDYTPAKIKRKIAVTLRSQALARAALGKIPREKGAT